jgi:hypothetical protein
MPTPKEAEENKFEGIPSSFSTSSVAKGKQGIWPSGGAILGTFSSAT